MTEFELFYRKIHEFAPSSEAQKSICDATIRALGEEHADKPPDLKSFSLSKKHLKARQELLNRHDIIVTRPDKGCATALKTHEDYINKMATILKDTTKFKLIGPVSMHDRTVIVEAHLVSYLNCGRKLQNPSS